MEYQEGEKMVKTPSWLLDHKSSIYSQSGEDGVIKKILEILPEKNKWCVEFGAWDGVHLSNVRNLIENEKYKAILIEGNPTRYKTLKNNNKKNKNVIAINTFVGFDQKDSLDKILSETPIPIDFDLLSIDIDGNDYHVWKAIEKYNPKVVCIEFNPTIATHIEFVQPADPSINQGSSVLSLTKLGKEKEYELVCVLDFNAFFVRAEFFPLFQIEDNSPELLRKNLEFVTAIFFGFDGKAFLRGNLKMPWHGIELKEYRAQQLPHFLQKFPEDYGTVERLVLILWNFFSNPIQYMKKRFF
jgi:hypothetical protein